MKNRRVIWAAVLLVAAAIIGVILRQERRVGPEPQTPGAEQVAKPAREQSVERLPPESSPQSKGPVSHTVAGRKPYDTGLKDDPRVQHTKDGKHRFVEALGLAGTLHQSEGSTGEDLEKINEILSFYRMIFQENPVAPDNRSVMAALMGENERDIVLFPADHPSLSADGELLDRWKSPYYFHPLSSSVMEIVSLGPDKTLGSDDDLIFTPRGERDFFDGITEKPDFDVEEEE